MTVSHASRHRPASPPSSGGMWRATMSGFSASLVGIGLAGFAYTRCWCTNQLVGVGQQLQTV